MIKYIEPDMEVIYFECDTVVCSNSSITGNDGPGDNGGEDYDNW